MITPASRAYLRLFEHYKNGILPRGGGILDQPHQYAEAMEILSGREAHIEAEAIERARREYRERHD